MQILTSSSSVMMIAFWVLMLTLSSGGDGSVWAAKPKERRTLAANSKFGGNLLRNAQKVKGGIARTVHRHLDGDEEEGQEDGGGNNNNNNNNNNYDNANGIYGLGNMYIKYLGCSQYEKQGNYNYNNGNNNGDGGGGSGDDNSPYNSFVRFTVCSSSSCGDNDGDCSGEYAVNMVEFLNAYIEQQQQDQQQQCEYVRQHCYCSSGYWENCLYNCYSSAGMMDCMNQYYAEGEGGENGGGFNLQEFIQCNEAYGGGGGDGNNNYNNGGVQFFVGPYCNENTGIFLGAYTDQYCTYQADSQYFQSLNYGDGFPYFYEPIITSDINTTLSDGSNAANGNNGEAPSQCLTTCMANDDQEQQQQQDNYYYYNGDGNYNNNDDYYNNQNYYYNAEANELCQMATQDAAFKCDAHQGYFSGCYFLNTTLPCLDGRGCPEDSSGGGGSWSGGGSPSWSSLSIHGYSLETLNEMIMEKTPLAIGIGVVIAAMLLFGTVLYVWCFVCGGNRSDDDYHASSAYMARMNANNNGGGRGGAKVPGNTIWQGKFGRKGNRDNNDKSKRLLGKATTGGAPPRSDPIERSRRRSLD